jgi:hypothetical protein
LEAGDISTEFLKGVIESIPLHDNTVDVIISRQGAKSEYRSGPIQTIEIRGVSALPLDIAT